jgi:hypothetical protein
MSCAPLPRCPVMSASNRHLNRHLFPKSKEPFIVAPIGSRPPHQGRCLFQIAKVWISYHIIASFA